MPVSNKKTENALRCVLEERGFDIKTSPRKNGETGVDIIAEKDGKEYYIEVIGYKSSGPARAKDFYESFFRAVSRLENGAENLVIALPREHLRGLSQRVSQHRTAWQRIGETFPELELWFVDVDNEGFEFIAWTDCLNSKKLQEIS